MDDYIKILEYELNNKKYVVYKANNEIKFGFIENDSISESLSDGELSFIKAIYNFIVGDNICSSILKA